MGAELFHTDTTEDHRKLNYLWRYIGVLISSDDKRIQHKRDLNFLDFVAMMVQSNALGRFCLSSRLAWLWWPHSTHSTYTKLVYSWQIFYSLFLDS